MVITSVFLCTTFTAFWGMNPYSVRMTPKGNCTECCPIEEKEDIGFYLYTRSNTMTPQRLWVDNATSLYESNLKMYHPTVIYVHGFTEQANAKGATTVKNAYLMRGSYNVIVVDWSPLCAFPWYAHAVVNTHAVGLYLAKFVRFIVRHGVPIKSIHLIGFSLGAEIVGFTGKDTTFGKLPRITVSCSHDRAWQYYAESILNEKGFPAVRCANYETFLAGVCNQHSDPRTNRSEIQYMGFAANPRLKGKFFLATNSREPFATNYRKL
ncbi:probable phospholipase A1 magnifin isoform X2 [Planococcus citri]|uniref:probable phospholipase A1 magnifin isoform X2 n=1 Tax=Planococcus citri TaxID=170843 RepID=UPI0031F9F461